MGTQIIQQPAGTPGAQIHYRDTVVQPVKLSRILSYMSPGEIKLMPESLVSRDSISVWGVKPGGKDVNVRRWNKVQVGDVVLFAGNKKIFSSGVVVYKTRNRALSLDLWKSGTSSDEVWEYVYFIDELTPRNISYSDYNRIAGYELTKNIQNFEVLSEEKSKRILFAFDLYSDTYFPPIEPDEFAKSVRSFDPSKPLDAKSESYARTEQGFLRSTLFGGKKEAECCICHKSYPVTFLVAAHIKKRAKCSDEERLDFENIVAPMCRFGCDELYEKGFISVDGAGRVVARVVPFSTAALSTYIQQIIGKSCKAWKNGSIKYFEWHHNNFL